MSKYWKIAGAIVIVTLLIVLVGVTITSAQDEPVTPVDPEPTVQPDVPLPYWGSGGRGPGAGNGLLTVAPEEMHTAVAEVLGISIEDLQAAIADGQTLYTLAQELGVDWSDVQAAMQAVHSEALQTAVDEGLITQEQADFMGDRLHMGLGGRFGDGMRGGRFGGGPMGRGLMAVDQAAMHEAIASALGISVEAFEAAITDGQTLFALAQELEVDWGQVQAAMQAVHDEALQQAIEEGLITQEQADLMGDRLQMGHGGQFGGGRQGGPRGGQFGGNGWRVLPES